MRSNCQTPSLARLSAIILGLFLSAPFSFADAQTLPEIQRLMKQNQMPQALENVDLYISTRPKDAQGRFLRGLILTAIGRPADAIAVFNKLTEDFPELPEPYNNLAVLYAQQKQYDKARGALEMAIRTNPNYAIAYDNLGDVYAKLASQAYDKAIQLDSSNTTAQTKLMIIRELISASSKPSVKPGTASTSPRNVPFKAAAATPTATPTAAPPVPTPPTNPPANPLAKVPEPSAATEMPKAVVSDALSEKSPLSANGESEVSLVLQGWASAWSRKDVKSYLGYYAEDYQTPNGMARKDWEAERTQSIEKPDQLRVSVDEINISVDGDKATVRFRQHYTSPTLKSSASKTLVLVKSGGKWLIQQERG